MWLTRFAIRNPVITAMFFIGLAVFGVMSYSRWASTCFRTSSSPYVFTVASYPGASPAEMEKLVIKPIEDQLDGIDNLDRMSATAQEGSATSSCSSSSIPISTTRRSTCSAASTRRASTCPPTSTPPYVDKKRPRSEPILEAALSSQVADAPRSSATSSTTASYRNSNTCPTSWSVDSAGDMKREFHVFPDPARLLGIERDARRHLQRARATTTRTCRAGGSTRRRARRASRFTPTSSSRSDILAHSAADLRTRASRSSITIGDVATVEDGHVEQRVVSTLQRRARPSMLDINRVVTRRRDQVDRRRARRVREDREAISRGHLQRDRRAGRLHAVPRSTACCRAWSKGSSSRRSC